MSYSGKHKMEILFPFLYIVPSQHLVDDPANQYLVVVHTAIQCIKCPKKYYEKVKFRRIDTLSF